MTKNLFAENAMTSGNQTVTKDGFTTPPRSAGLRREDGEDVNVEKPSIRRFKYSLV